MPVTMPTLLAEVENSCRAGADYLAENWLLECAEIALKYKDEIEEFVPSENSVSVGVSQHFFIKLSYFETRSYRKRKTK